MKNDVLAGLASFAMVFAIPLAVQGTPVAVEEDDPGWSCVDDGNKVCGPDNDEGQPAGRYDDGGVLVDPWPLGGSDAAASESPNVTIA
jgi:hypothetical protein